jgi:predicted nucleic acid-binding protein
MIAVDANVIVRLLTKDDAQQYRKAYELLKTQDIFIADTVILETERVLRFAYEFSEQVINDALVNLFGLENVYLANPQVMARAIDWHCSGLDFADALHLANCQAAQTFYTFDKAFASKAKGLSGCPVQLA